MKRPCWTDLLSIQTESYGTAQIEEELGKDYSLLPGCVLWHVLVHCWKDSSPPPTYMLWIGPNCCTWSAGYDLWHDRHAALLVRLMLFAVKWQDAHLASGASNRLDREWIKCNRTAMGPSSSNANGE